jgi:hypothetical protein
MKLTILLFFCVVQIAASGQATLVKISETYFRSRPFKKPYNAFIDHLVNDPTMIQKTITKKTDSTGFFLKADYTSHNPFLFPAIKTTIIFSEKEELVDDSSGRTETIYLYQILGYAQPGEEGLKDVQNQYEKFCKRFKKGFNGSEYKEITTAGKTSAEISDFILHRADFFPMTVAWASSKERTENVFALTVRFRVLQNMAYLWMINE